MPEPTPDPTRERVLRIISAVSHQGQAAWCDVEVEIRAAEQAAREERDREWEDAWSTREGRLRDELYSRDELKAARRKALEEAAEAAMDQVCDNAGFWYHWLRARAEEEG
jgi:hypothetical protein